MTYQFWHYVHLELNKGVDPDIAIVLIFVVSFIVFVVLIVLALYATLKEKIKLILYWYAR